MQAELAQTLKLGRPMRARRSGLRPAASGVWWDVGDPDDDRDEDDVPETPPDEPRPPPVEDPPPQPEPKGPYVVGMRFVGH
jgi:hypothetical protein